MSRIVKCARRCLGADWRTAGCLVALLAVAPVGLAGQDGSPCRDLTRDVDEAVRLIETHHPRPFGKITRESWLAEGDRIRAAARDGEAPSDLAVRMMEWVARLGDGHTNIEPEGIGAFARWYPVRMYEFADGLYVTGAVGDGLDLNGARVLRIGGAGAEAVAERQARLQGSDNAFGAREERYLLSNAGVMEALGFVAPDGPMRLTVLVGTDTIETAIEPVDAPFTFGWRFLGELYGPPLEGSGSWRAWHAAFDGSGVETYRTPDPDRPPHLQYRLPYRYTRLGDNDDVVYFAFNFTQNWHGESLAEYVEGMYAALDSLERPTLIIDLRYNSGGDGSLILPIVHGIIRDRDLDDPERLFVLTGPKTFSAAVMLVGELARHTNATFLGTPPGAPLNHYGDARDFVLPCSGMRLWVSTLYHQYGGAGDTSDLFPVDVPAPMTGSAYFAGRDPALEAILGAEDTRPITAIAATDGADSARAVAQTRREEAVRLGWADWQPFSEAELKYLGYEEFLQGRSERAVGILKLVTEVYADSWDAWDRLGQALEGANRPEAAIAAFRRSLDLNPENSAGTQAIQRLRDEGRR